MEQPQEASSDSHRSSASSSRNGPAPIAAAVAAVLPTRLQPINPVLPGVLVGPRPPLHASELDVHRNKYLGLKVIAFGKVDPKREGIEGKHWVQAADLPEYSTVSAENYFPYQPKRICFELNKQNIIVWVRYA